MNSINRLKNIVLYTIINLAFILLFLFNSIGEDFYLVSLIIVISYLIFIFSREKKDIITNQIILSIMLSLVYDYLWRKTGLDIPLELKLVIDIISLILLFKIVMKPDKYIKILKDKIILLSLIFISLSFIISMANSVSFSNYITSLRIYIRFLPTYIILSNEGGKNSKIDLMILIMVNLLLIPIQAMQHWADDVAGVFGISGGQYLFLFTVIIYSIAYTLYLNKKISFMVISFITTIIFVIYGLGEIKVAFFIIPIILIVINILNSRNLFKKINIVLILFLMMYIGVNIVIKVSPNFQYFFEYGSIKQNIINYTMRTNDSRFYLGRFENVIYTDKHILTDYNTKLLGKGIGAAMPNETWYYELDSVSKGRSIRTFESTEMFKSYGPYFGYHLSGINVMWIETGYIGLTIYCLVMIIGSYRSIMLIKKSKDIRHKCLGNASIGYLVAWIPLMFYYNYLIDRNSIIMLVMLFGLVNFELKSINNNKKL